MTKSAPHVLFDISGHGFGHAAMTAPIINALRQARPDIRVTVRTQTPKVFLDQILDVDYSLIPESTDFGMMMHDAFRVNTQASLSAYQQAHRNWPDKISIEADKLRDLQPNLLVSNISYLSIVAAAEANIPSLAYSCLNWAEIFDDYFHGNNDAQVIYQQMLEAYRHADVFLRPAPAMPMQALNTQSIGPVASIGKNHHQHICSTLNLPPHTKLTIASLGGVSTQLSCQHWPELSHHHYLVPGDVQNAEQRADVSTLQQAQVQFQDALASASVYLTKPGYGAFSGAACHGIPVIYTERDQWPEQTHLVEWLNKQVACEKISQQQLQQGHFEQALVSLLNKPKPDAIPPLGTQQCVNQILKLLASR